MSAWDSPSAEDARWGIETLRQTGQPFAAVEDPVRELKAQPQQP